MPHDVKLTYEFVPTAILCLRDSLEYLMQRRLLSSYDVEPEESKPGNVNRTIHTEAKPKKAPSRYGNLT